MQSNPIQWLGFCKLQQQQQKEATTRADVLQAFGDDVEDSIGVGGAEDDEVGDREPEQSHRPPAEDGEHDSRRDLTRLEVGVEALRQVNDEHAEVDARLQG